jgi:hypothetical protein
MVSPERPECKIFRRFPRDLDGNKVVDAVDSMRLLNFGPAA